MWTISAQHVDGSVRVRVSRWVRAQRFPVELAEFELLDCIGESELALLERVGLAASRECSARRSTP